MSNTEDLYGVSWSNPAWSHFLCSANILDYFCDLSNPFYDRQCNNEVIRMQRLHPEQLLAMTGIEFYLHHAQEPILFVIRKQQRLSSTQVTPLAYYYIINGTVLQSPDLFALLNSRLLTTVTGLKKFLHTMASCSRYHPSDGSYSWDDPNILLGLKSSEDLNNVEDGDDGQSKSNSIRVPIGNLFQVQRTDLLLSDWLNRFPTPMETNFFTQSTISSTANTIITTSAQITTNLSTNSSITSSSVPVSIKAEETSVTHSKGFSRLSNSSGINNAVSAYNNPMTTSSQALATEKKPRI